MKTHEETWTAADGGCVFEGEHIATFWGACSVADPRAVLAAAAPEMARALPDALREGGNAAWMDGNERQTLHQVIRAALTKAGVL